jgi:hypothetical protein
MVIKNNNNAKTNKRPNTNNNSMGKIPTSISLGKDVLDQLNKHCEENCINRSSLIEKLILRHLDGGDGK